MSYQPHPGMLVVCVDASETNSYGHVELVLGQVYTIRFVCDPDPLISRIFGRPLDEPGVLLVEVRRPVDPEYGEFAFGAWRFRPLDDAPRALVLAEADDRRVP